MYNRPLVSVLIPCYNVSAYVEKAIRSILKQTYANLEIWVIDDASTDDTLQKIRAIKDERIKVVACKQNTQKVGAVNEVLKHVNGKLICFQDADDWSEPSRIEQQVQQFKNDPDLGICFTKYCYTGLKNTLPCRIALCHEELSNEFLEYGKHKNSNFDPTACATMMVTKMVLQNTGGYNPYFAGRVAEDIQWIFRILKTYKGITIDELLYNYSSREGSFTHLQFEGKNAKYAYSWQLLTKIIHKDIYDNIDVLEPESINVLKELELEACEEALIENIKLVNETRSLYENSFSFKLGKFLLTPWFFLRSFNK